MRSSWGQSSRGSVVITAWIDHVEFEPTFQPFGGSRLEKTKDDVESEKAIKKVKRYLKSYSHPVRMERGSHLCVLTPLSKRQLEDPEEDNGGQNVMFRAWLTH